jgi:hypothetical protein
MHRLMFMLIDTPLYKTATPPAIFIEEIRYDRE